MNAVAYGVKHQVGSGGELVDSNKDFHKTS